jgi:hypothetical protein
MQYDENAIRNFVDSGFPSSEKDHRRKFHLHLAVGAQARNHAWCPEHTDSFVILLK